MPSRYGALSYQTSNSKNRKLFTIQLYVLLLAADNKQTLNIYKCPPNRNSFEILCFFKSGWLLVVFWEKTFHEFSLLAVLARSSKFQSYLYKTKQQNKNLNRRAVFWHFRKQVRVIACLCIYASVAFL